MALPRFPLISAANSSQLPSLLGIALGMSSDSPRGMPPHRSFLRPKIGCYRDKGQNSWLLDKLLGIIPSLGSSPPGAALQASFSHCPVLAILAFIIVTLKSVSLFNGLPSSLHLSICPENYLRQMYLLIHPNTVYLPMDLRALSWIL